MKYIVLDLEWNQPSWRGATIEDPVHLVGEIVQIGAVKMNRHFRIRKELRLTVTPQYYRRMHKKVARITGLSTADVKKGLPFPEAVRRLRRFCGKNFVFLTWGPDDLPMLYDNLKLFGLDEDWVPDFYDLQVLFADQIAHERRQFSLETAMEMLGEAQFRAHDALCDAHSTALICRHLDMKEGLRTYAMRAGDITTRPLEDTLLPQRFPERAEALAELADAPFCCPVCGDYLSPEAAIGQNPHKYLSLAHCSCKRDYLIRWKLFRETSGDVRVRREIYAINEALQYFYEEKRLSWLERCRKERERDRAKRKRRKYRNAAEPSAAAKTKSNEERQPS